MLHEEKRYFTVEEANAMIPELERSFIRILQIRPKIHKIQGRLERKGAAPEVEDFEFAEPGMSPETVQDRATLKALVETVQDEIERLHRQGCLVKGLEPALVDWYAQRDGEDVFLCWKLGEKEVNWWHGINAGYTSRRPVSEL